MLHVHIAIVIYSAGQLRSEQVMYATQRSISDIAGSFGHIAKLAVVCIAIDNKNKSGVWPVRVL